MNCVICDKPVPQPKRGPQGKTCSPACKQKLYRSVKPVTLLPALADASKTRNTLPDSTYTADCVRVLSDSERLSMPMFDWELAANLADEYSRPVEYVKRGIQACRESGKSPQYFIDRYLEASYLARKSIPMDAEVDDAFRLLLAERAA